MRLWAALRQRPLLGGAIALIVSALLAFAIYWFEPHALLIDERASESAPEQAAELASGTFASLEHETSGRASIVKLPDGRRVLRLEDLNTSNGPELRVYLSSVPAQDDWFVYDDGPFVDLGDLKGNLGSSNYDIPSDVDLKRHPSAVIWCRRFSVGFGVAALRAP